MFYEVFRDRYPFIFSGGGVEVTLPLVDRCEVRLFLAMRYSVCFGNVTWDGHQEEVWLFTEMGLPSLFSISL